ncbi:MAG: response regulator [Planctomycetaceae bacterium]|nr:response regulator [Planctomycetaceae bacterium]
MTTKILIVDDSQVERLLVEGLLRTNPDYQVASASQGEEALEMIATFRPHLLITDLIMPGMDGLELVQRVHYQYPEIPVILMTAYGDDSTVIEALEAGAASFISKTQKAERLTGTVKRVLARAAADQIHQQLSQCLLESRCRFAVPNSRQVIRGLVEQMQQTMAGMGFGNTVERIRVGEAVEEAMLNAMFHGNLELNAAELSKVRAELDDDLLDRLIEDRCQDPRIGERRIVVVMHITSSEARFVIRDQGRGFDALYRIEENKTEQNQIIGQRGLTLIRSLMDEVKYNEAGNELVLRKRYQIQESQSDSTPIVAEVAK